MKELSILELFILSCIDRGLTTPYLMQREGGLSLGATSPTLPKLVKLGLVRRTTEKTSRNRPRHDYSLTSEGKQQVKRGWRTHLDAPAPPADLDALLRLLDMAIYNGASTSAITELVTRAARSRANMAERVSLEVAEVQPAQSVSYRSAKVKLDSIRYRAEADGLNALASEIGRTGTVRNPKPRK